MPRKGKGPQLYLKRRPVYDAFWYIRDGQRRIATGFSESEREGALGSLARYIAKTRTPAAHETDPHVVSVSSVIDLYAQDRAPKTARPRATASRLDRLLNFFGKKTVAYITPASCARFVDEWGSEQAARRALEDLRAALIYAWKCRRLSVPVPVTMPPKAQPRERFLTPAEMCRLISATRGMEHLTRFVILGLYTGTRSSAILSLGWKPHKDGGYVDLENGVLYRKAAGARETNKRQPKVKIAPILLERLKRWRAASSGLYIVEWEGRGVDSVKRSWATARARAGLSDDVTPHTLRHSFVTRLLHRGVSLYDAAEMAGMSARMAERVYGHHSLEFQEKAAKAIG